MLFRRWILTLVSLLVVPAVVGPAAPAVASDGSDPSDAVQLSASNPGVGALGLTATVPDGESANAAIVFQVEGRDPVMVVLGNMTVAGEPDFGAGHAQPLVVPQDAAVLDVPGLDPAGTYRATAYLYTFDDAVAHDPTPAVTTTLTRTKPPFLFTAERDGRRVTFKLGVVAYPTSTVLGTIKIVDLTTKTTMVWGLNAWAQVGATYTLRHPSRPAAGDHRYRATFKPSGEFQDSMGPMTVTSAKVRFPG